MAQAGLPLPPPQPLAASRARARRTTRDGAPPPLALMFRWRQGTAKMLEAPARQAAGASSSSTGSSRGDAARQARRSSAARAAVSARLVGREYVEQFARAVRAAVGVKTDAAALAAVRGDLTGAAAPAN